MTTHQPNPVFGVLELLAIATSGLAIRASYLFAQSPSPTDWQGIAAAITACAALMVGLGTLATTLVKLWIQVRGLEEKASKAEADMARTTADADAKIVAAKAEADRETQSLKDQNARQQKEIDLLRQWKHDSVDTIHGIQLAVASKTVTPNPDSVLKVNVVNSDAHPVPVSVPVKDH